MHNLLERSEVSAANLKLSAQRLLYIRQFVHVVPSTRRDLYRLSCANRLVSSSTSGILPPGPP